MDVGAFLGNTKLGKLFSQKSSTSITVSDSASKIISLPSATFITSGSPSWRNLSELLYLLDCYCENPIVQAIINIKADAFSNIKFFVKDLKTGEKIPLEAYDDDGGKLRDLIAEPNPLQSTMEWLKQLKVNYEVFGNGYSYASVPVGWEDKFTYEDINVINNLPPYCIAPVLTGKWLDATSKDQIIKEYKFSGFKGNPKFFPTNTIFHINNVNIKLNKNFTEGSSDLVALQRPISNIDAAYESRNVLIRRRGAIGAWTSEKKDEAMGSLPMDDKEIELVQEAFSKYGLMEDQYSQIISPLPLKYTKTAMNVKELMLFEEIESDAIAIAVAKGVPELLVKYYLKGGTFKNLDASEKRLYDSTIIPESESLMTSINNFLGTKEHGIELIGSFDHLKCLQINKKEEAGTKKINEATALSAFKHGAITYNDYLMAFGFPMDDEIGELRIWDLKPKQQRAIGINITENKGSDGEE